MRRDPDRERWENANGYRVTGRTRCPYCVLRVRNHTERGVYGHLFATPAAMDHAFNLRAADGRRAVLFQPYGFDYYKRKELEDWCARWGLTYRRLGEPGFHHNTTTAIVVWKEQR